MAAVTQRIATASTSNVSSYASGAFTPTANSMLVVEVSTTGTTVTPTLTASANGYTFTLINYCERNAGADRVWLFTSNQNCGGTPASMTLTFDCTGDPATGAIIVAQDVTSMSKFGATAVRQFVALNTQAGATTPTYVFGSACQTGNPTLTAKQFVATTNITTTPAGWTERVDPSTTNYATPTNAVHVATRDSGFTGTTITWGGTVTTYCGFAVELDAAPPAAVTQAGFRFYADGTETGSTALAGQDTAPTVDVTSGDANLGLRMRLQETAGGAVPATDDWQLQWEKNTSGTWANAADTGVAFTYDEANESSFTTFSGNVAAAVDIQGNGKPLRKLRLKLFKSGTPTASLTGRLYANDGGTGNPGAILQSSTSSVDGTSLSTTTAWVDFDFDGSVTLASGTAYHVGVGLSGVDAAVRIGLDSTAPTYSGVSRLYSGSFWSGQAYDFIFEVHTSGLGTTVAPYASPNLTDGAATTSRLTGGTGSFVAGKVSEDGLVDDLGWTASNFTELLYSTTLKAADLTNADTLRFRVLKNGATTGLTYTAVPTINVAKGAGGTTVNATVALTAASTLTATGTVVTPTVVSATVALAATSTLTATAVRVPQATVGLTATSTLTTTALRTVEATAALTAVSTLTATGVKTGLVPATVALTATSTLTATAVRTVTVGGAAVPYLTEILTDTPSVLWLCDEAAGAATAADSSGNGKTGTKGASVTFGAAGSGLIAGYPTAATFAGTVSAANLLSAALTPLADGAAYSVEAWVRTVTVGSQYAVGDVGGTSGNFRGMLIATSTGHAGMRAWNTSSTQFDVTSTALLNDGQPHLVVAVVNGSTLTLYLDGVESTAAITGPFRALQTFRCGGSSNGSNPFSGSLAGVAFYPAALSAARVAAHYAAGTGTGGAAGVPLTATSTLTATAVRIPQASVSLTATSTLTATAVREVPATTALSAVSTLVATGTTVGQVPASVALSAVSTLSATALRIPQASVSLVAASTLVAGGVRVAPATVSLSAASTLMATAVRVPVASVSLTATSTLTAAGIRTQEATAALSAASQLTTGGLVSRLPTVALSAVSTLSATAVRIPQASVSLTAASTLSVTALRTAPATVGMSAVSTLTTTASTLGLVTAVASLTASSTLSTTGFRAQAASAALTSVSTLTSTAVRIPVASASLTATSTLTSTAVRVVPSTVALTSVSTLTTSGVRVQPAIVALSAASTLTTTGVVITPTGGAAALSAVSTLTAGAVRTQFAAVTMTATATLVTSGVRVRVLSVQLSATSTLTTGPVRIQPAQVQLVSISTLDVGAVRVPQGAAALTALSVLTVTATVIVPGAGIPDVAETGHLHALDVDLNWYPVTAIS